jgi:hypothetical protein
MDVKAQVTVAFQVASNRRVVAIINVDGEVITSLRG